MSLEALDRTDRLILAELQKDGRIANSALAKRLRMTESTCLRRVRRLEESGIIDGYAALVNPAKLGLTGTIFVRITLVRQQQKDLAEFERAVSGVPEVLDCYLMSGEADYLLRILVGGVPDFERIHNVLTRLPGVERVQSSLALRTVMQTGRVPLR
jgi:Lrp/AsnC family transcriptional regulator, leucine-responsive regulatory protein